MQFLATQQNIDVKKNSSCEKLSGRGTLQYQIGCNGKTEPYVRIIKNSRAGLFSSGWVSLKLLITRLQAHEGFLNSYALQPLYKDQSRNTAAFILAALKAEGLLIDNPAYPKSYLLQPIDIFMEKMAKLMNAPIQHP